MRLPTLLAALSPLVVVHAVRESGPHTLNELDSHWTRSDYHNQQLASRFFLKANPFAYRKRQDYITNEDSTNPIQAAKDVQAIPYLANNVSRRGPETNNCLLSLKGVRCYRHCLPNSPRRLRRGPASTKFRSAIHPNGEYEYQHSRWM